MMGIVRRRSEDGEEDRSLREGGELTVVPASETEVVSDVLPLQPRSGSALC